MKGRRIINFNESWSIAGSGGLEIWVSVISFWKSDLGWPQQPLAEKLLKFNMIFHDSNKKIFFQNIKIKLNLRTWMTEILSSDFTDLRTSAASFHQKHYRSWWLDHPRHPNDQYQSLFVEWIIKSPVFHWYLIPFCWRLLRPVDATFS